MDSVVVATRRCSKCGEDKPYEAFSKSRNPSVWCRACCRRNAAEWRDKNRNKARANDRERNVQRRAAPESRRWMHDYKLAWKYGLTREQYDALLIAQLGRCALCDREPEDNLCVDHDHATGTVRGLLCSPCNRAIGVLGDDESGLLRALAYLRSGTLT